VRAVSDNRLRPQVVLLGLVSLLNDSASEMIYPLLPVFLTVTLGATAFDVGLIEGLAEALASILKYWFGRWSDRLSRRRPLISSGYALAAGSRALIAAATAWPFVLAARLIDRTGKGIRSAPRDALISDVTPPEQRGRAYGFHRALDHTGAVVGPLIAFALLQGFHLATRTVFYIAVVPGFIAVVLLLTLLDEPARTPRQGAEATSRAPLPRTFWHALAAIALFSLANSSDAFLLLQANRAGVSAAMLPLLWAAHHVIKSLFSTKAGALSDRTSRRTLLMLGWTIYAAIYFAFPAAQSMTSFFVLFIVYAIPFTLTEGAERAWISDLVPAETRGRSFGLYYLTTGVFVLGGTLLFGELYDRVGHRAAFWTGAALALVAAITVSAAPPGSAASSARAATPPIPPGSGADS
jgi:MFS family permease